MAIQIGCTGCGKLLSVADEHAGKKARCPACSAILVVPLATGSTQDNSIPSQDGNPWAAPPTTGVYTPPFSNTPVAGQPTVEQFWMRATDGSIYGPTDRDNLNRWFREGRIGAGYQVRRGEDGVWEDATIFRPQAPGAVDILGTAPSVTGSGGMAASSTSNPYAAQYTATGTAAASSTLPCINIRNRIVESSFGNGDSELCPLFIFGMWPLFGAIRG